MQDREFWLGRLAVYRLAVRSGSPRLWLHASSVGEVTGAMACVFDLRRHLPECSLVLTVGTLQGFRFARRQLGPWVDVFALPLDLPWMALRAWRHFRPDLYLGFESEYWPCLLWLLNRKGTPAIVLNGRLSERSSRFYAKFPSLFRPLFRQYRWLAMITDADRRHALRLGASPDRIRVLGSSKYDTLVARAQLPPTHPWKRILRCREKTPVLIGGSLRGRECHWLLETFLALRATATDLMGIFAPRHLHRIDEMARYLKDKGVGYHRLSDLVAGQQTRREAIVLVDRIGVLFELYAFGDLIFCGGTLEPIGGHNIVEPAAWGKPVTYGPHVDKVTREHQVLQSANASQVVADPACLTRAWRERLLDLRRQPVSGCEPRQALRVLGGVAAEQTALILETLNRQGHPKNPLSR